MDHFIPLSIPNFEGNEETYVLDAVRQGWVSTGGAYITKLEGMLRDFLKAPGVAACQSGTAGLHLALMECGVRPGELVIVPTLTFIAAVNPVRYQFADPIFMDCDDSLCMDPVKLARFCEEECELRKEECGGAENGAGAEGGAGAETGGAGVKRGAGSKSGEPGEYLVYRKTGQRIRAIVVVHVFGNLADMEAIMDIAGRYHLRVVEDATEALGSHFLTGRYAGKMAGTIGDFGAFSFNGNKIITTGGGGAVTAADPDELAHMRYISTQAKDDPVFYEHNEVGCNYRMTNLQAALGVAQMEELPEFIRRKDRNYHLYREQLSDFEKGSLLPFRPSTKPNYWFYSLSLEPEARKEGIRSVVTKLQGQGVQTRPIWGLIHRQKPYQGCISYEIEKADCYSERILNIPCGTQLTEEEISYVARALKEL